jgi:hypothetical protein
VSRFPTLVLLAVRELWISFELLVMLATLLLAGMAAALGPMAFGAEPQAAYGVALATTGVVCAAVAALGLAGERAAGSLAWLAVRAVPRAAVLVSWLVALSLVAAAGLALATLVAWLAVVGQPADAIMVLLLGTAASGATILLALSIGLLAGALLPGPLAAVTAALATAALAATALLAGPMPLLPSSGFALLVRADDQAEPIRVALQSAGVALALSGALLAVAIAALERDDL